MLFCIPFAKAQNKDNNINVYNGLPSNHVYSAIKDNYGYLWFCTTDGVVKYNGYDCKVFNFSDGLARNDVFGLYLDRKNRIWLRCISDKLGYIYNDVYHDVPILYNKNILYPKHIVDYDSGVLFSVKNQSSILLGIEKNDTIKMFDTHFPIAEVTNEGGLITSNINNTAISLFSYRDGQPLKAECTCLHDFSLYSDLNPKARKLPFFKHYIQYITGTSEIIALNMSDCAVKKLVVRDSNNLADNIHLIYNNGNKLFAICDRNIFEFDTTISLTGVYPIKDFANNPSLSQLQITGFYTDNFWNKCITTTGGIYFDNSGGEHLKKIEFNLSAFSLLGNINDTLTLWKNDRQQQYLTFGASGNISVIKTPEFSTATIVTPYREGEALLLTRKQLYRYYYKTAKLKAINKKDNNLLNLRPYSIIVSNDRSVYITGSAIGPRLFKFFPDSVQTTTINEYWYKYLTYDVTKNIVWFYSLTQVLLHTAYKDIILKSDVLKQYGIKVVEKILIDDNSGNIYIKDYKHLWMFNTSKRTITSLFRNYNLKNAVVFIKNGKLILIGQFGLLFSQIRPDGSVSDPIVYSNTRDNLYHAVEEVAIAGKTVLIKTDNGVYSTKIPADTLFLKSQKNVPAYKVLLNYRNEIYSIPLHKILLINQDDNKIQFDIINPNGSGKLHYQYRINETDTAWTKLDNDIIYLPRLKVGHVYTISIIAGDDVWRSNTIQISIIIMPHWWQTNKGLLIISIIAFVIVIDILSWVIWLTHKSAMRADEKKRAIIALELRAVYSQLNPHFIFNTLNSALHFIKKNRREEAVAHVSKFSRLLRAYLESSRNRFITIADEITNLKNYIELQQTRFGNVFTYSIHSDHIDGLSGIYIPSLLLQPIVENAIIHGLLPLDEPGGHLYINFEKQEPYTIKCTIDDNGVGREKAGYEPGNKKSFGNELLRELITLFNKQDNLGIDITYIDKANNKGTTVIVKITKPLYEKSF
ncbi:MAG: hypothetical protein BGO70_02265 [Bacteroidetes bacterium 43-93]|nr:MAG: hypothetical protein BGO70_02265 [Bacteroidetes bacterium 43-93]